MRLFGRDRELAAIAKVLDAGEVCVVRAAPGDGASAVARAAARPGVRVFDGEDAGEPAGPAIVVGARDAPASATPVRVLPLDPESAVAWLRSATGGDQTISDEILVAIAGASAGSARLLEAAAGWLPLLGPREVLRRLGPRFAAPEGEAPVASAERALAVATAEEISALERLAPHDGEIDLALAEVAIGEGALAALTRLERVDLVAMVVDAGGTRVRVAPLVRAAILARLERDDGLDARALVARSEARRDQGRVAEALADARAAEALADDADARALAARAVARASLSAGDVAGARDAAERARLSRGSDMARALARAVAGQARAAAGLVAEARMDQLVALDAFEDVGAARLAGIARSHLGLLTHRLGALREAREWHEGALAVHRATGNTRYAGAELMHLGYVLHEAGDGAAAAARYDEAIATLTRAGDQALAGVAHAFRARLAIDDGELARAREGLAAARARLEAPRHLATCDLFEGHLELEAGDAARAVLAYERAREAGTGAEVGFERLGAAYLALARARAGADRAAVERDLDAAAAEVAGAASPWIHASYTLLAALARGEPLPETPSGARESSSDVRRALRLAARGGDAPFVVDRDGRAVVLPTGGRLDLSRKGAVRRILVALARARLDAPGRALSLDELVVAGWPGERLLAEAGQKRAYTAVWTLRAQVFGDRLLTRDDGYLLDPALPLRFEDL